MDDFTEEETKLIEDLSLKVFELLTAIRGNFGHDIAFQVAGNCLIRSFAFTEVSEDQFNEFLDSIKAAYPDFAEEVKKFKAKQILEELNVAGSA